MLSSQWLCKCLFFPSPISDGREEQTVARASWAGWAKAAADYEKSGDSTWSRGWTGSENCSPDKGTGIRQLVNLDILMEMTSKPMESVDFL